MIPEPTHISSRGGELVVAIEDLSAEDLAHLLALKRAEPDAERERDEHELRRCLWRHLRKMPIDQAREIAEKIGNEHPGVLLEVYWQAFSDAIFGPGPVPTIGYFRRQRDTAVTA